MIPDAMSDSARDTATSYRIDAGDRIVEVGGAWLAFARSNDAYSLGRDEVLGQPIWSFIDGPEVREIYALLFSAARERNQAVNVPFRCDSADTRRYMDMTITPCGNGGLNIVSTLRRSEPRNKVHLLEAANHDEERLLLICSWCKRVQIESGAWMEVEGAVRCMGLLDEGPLPTLSHGICSHCRKVALARTH